MDDGHQASVAAPPSLTLNGNNARIEDADEGLLIDDDESLTANLLLRAYRFTALRQLSQY